MNNINLFCIFKSEDNTLCMAVNPVEYWKAYHYLYDGSVDMSMYSSLGIGGELQECIYELTIGNTEAEINKLKSDLIATGMFIEDKEFTEFIEGSKE